MHDAAGATSRERFMRGFSLLATIGLCLASCSEAKSAGLEQKLQTMAEEGNAEASYHLGMLYNNGIGVPQDPQRAFHYFEAAAKGGDPLGAYKVGCYYAGQFSGVVPLDEGQALRMKLKAAEAGYQLAQLDVGIMYTQQGDHAQALPWFEAAARQGDPQALYNLSVFYKDGLGTAPSRARSYAFFRLAHLASRGSVSPAAQKQLDEIAAPMTEAERAEAERIATEFVTGPSPLTIQAFDGQERAEKLAAVAAS